MCNLIKIASDNRQSFVAHNERNLHSRKAYIALALLGLFALYIPLFYSLIPENSKVEQ